MRYVKLTAGILSVGMLCHPNKKTVQVLSPVEPRLYWLSHEQDRGLTKTDASKSTLYFILVNNKEKSLTVSYSVC